MKVMGIEALVPKPSLSIPNKNHKIHLYLLRDLEVTEVDQVWCADITCLPMEKGHAYLVAIMDWKSRAVLSWELSKINNLSVRPVVLVLICLLSCSRILMRVKKAKSSAWEQVAHL